MSLELKQKLVNVQKMTEDFAHGSLGVNGQNVLCLAGQVVLEIEQENVRISVGKERLLNKRHAMKMLIVQVSYSG